MKKNFFLKFFAIMTFSFIIYTVLFGTVMSVMVYRYALTEKQKSLLYNAERVAQMRAYVKENYSPLVVTLVRDNIAGIVTSIDASIILTDEDGLIELATSPESLTSLDKEVNENIMDVILKGKNYSSVSDFGALYYESVYTVGVPIELSDGSIAGGVFISTATPYLEELMSSFRGIILNSFIYVIILSLIMVFFVIRKFTKPIADLSLAANDFAKGNFDTRVKVSSNDEIGYLAQSFNSMAMELSKLEETRASFIANVSHDLKTPITTISGFVDGILDGTIAPKDQKHYLEIVSQESKRMSRMIKNLLDLSRLEAGEYKLNIVTFDLCSLAGEVLLSFEQAIKEKNVYVEVHFDDDILNVVGDYDTIFQVVYNLTDNAVKFVNENGIITITIAKEGKKARFTIKNTGLGISVENQKKIFDRFYKTDFSRGVDKSGVGLGLHIVRNALLEHGEDIELRSVENEYASFSFSLALSD